MACPVFFGTVMGRVNIINFNLLTLPKTACLNPSPSFYRQFQGYTLGLAAAIAGIGALWAFGAHVVAPVTLRRVSPAERDDRLARFGSTCLARALLVLYLVRPDTQCSACLGQSASRAAHAGVSRRECDHLQRLQLHHAGQWRVIPGRRHAHQVL
jgi:hypothetical protein